MEWQWHCADGDALYGIVHADNLSEVVDSLHSPVSSAFAAGGQRSAAVLGCEFTGRLAP